MRRSWWEIPPSGPPPGHSPGNSRRPNRSLSTRCAASRPRRGPPRQRHPCSPGIAELLGGDFSIGYESADYEPVPIEDSHIHHASPAYGEGNVHRLPLERGRRTASTRKSTRFGRLPPQGHAKPAPASRGTGRKCRGLEGLPPELCARIDRGPDCHLAFEYGKVARVTPRVAQDRHNPRTGRSSASLGWAGARRNCNLVPRSARVGHISPDAVFVQHPALER